MTAPQRGDPPDDPAHLNIVLAEDNEDLALLNEVVLEAEGHDVIVARDGREAVEAVRAVDPDLLLLDLDMPAATGVEVVEQLSQSPATADQAVVVMSNHDVGARAERRLMDLGVVDYLAKWKFGPTTLAGWIRRWTTGQVRRFALRGKRL